MDYKGWAQPWVQRASMPAARMATYSFEINGKIYVGGGFSNSSAQSALYEYDPATNSWTTKTSTPQPIYGSAYFVLGNKGYVVCGYSPNTSTLAKKVFRYDPTTDTWQIMNDFPGSARCPGMGFAVNGYGYIAGGFWGGSNPTINELWKYNPNTDTWTRMTDIPDNPNAPYTGRSGLVVFVVNDSVFLGLGGNGSAQTVYNDMFKYSFNIDNGYGSGSAPYTPRAPLPIGRMTCASFVIGNTGYVGLGNTTSGQLLADWYKYDPTTNTWTANNNFDGGTRSHTFSQVVNGVPYVGTGNGSGVSPGGPPSTFVTQLPDVWTWEFPQCSLNAHLGNDTAICTGSIITLADTNTNAAYLWSTNETTQSIFISTSGTYWVEVTKDGCTDRDTINVTTITAPTSVNIGNDTTYCGAFTRTLQVNPAGYNVLWSSNQTTNSITINNAGTYWAEISNQCGAVRDSIILSQNPAPVVNIGVDTTLCIGNTLILSDTITNAAYLWNTNATSASINVTAAGTYWLQVTKNGCTGRDSVSVAFITAPASVNIGNDSTYCGTFNRTLQVNTPYSVLWSTNQTTNSITVNNAGMYWAEISNQCGTVRDSIILTQIPLPPVNIGADTTLCVGNTLILSDTITNASYLWNTNATSNFINVNTAGTYWLQVTKNGCTARDSVNVNFINAPVAFSLGNDTVYCGTFNRTLQVNTPYSVLWSTNQTTNSITVNSAGTYWAEISNQCGATRDTIVLTQNPLPTIDIGNAVIGCSGYAVTLNAAIANATYLWQNNSTNPTYSTYTAGTYWVQITVNGCSATDSANVSFTYPMTEIEVDTLICDNASIQLGLVSPFAASYLWNTNATTSVITIADAGTYIQTAANACGEAVNTFHVTEKECICIVTFPTAFSPNSDGLNDDFGAVYDCPLTQFELHIYNSWGEKVFSSNDVNKRWDSKHKKQAQPLDVYMYYAIYTDPYENKRVIKSGNVTLVW